MKLGVFLPISGRAAGPEALTRAAGQAEALGFASIWSADRVVTPWEIRTTYPYSAEAAFIVPPDRPFLDSMTCLAFLAGCTRDIQLGISVLVLPYRHPLYWSRVATTLDRLSHGRFILGVGCGWMEEEFAAQGIDFHARGKATDEQLQIAQKLWSQDHITFSGEQYSFEDVALYPKPTRPGGLPTWIGGEGRPARRRAGCYGDAWFPYFVSITASDLATKFTEVRAFANEAGRNPSDVQLCLCRPIELTDGEHPQDPSELKGNARQLREALQEFADVGVQHLALQFMAPRLPDRLEQIGRFGRDVLPHL